MKKQYLSCLTLLVIFITSSLPVQGQITITSADMPSSGDTIRYSSALAVPGFNPSQTGANFNWDFSSLGLSGQDIYEHKLSGQTPYLFNFGFTAIGLKIAESLGTADLAIQNVYQFFQKNNNTFSARGLGFQISLLPLPLAGTYSSEDIIYRFPLNYNDSFAKPFALSIPLGTPPFSLGTFFRTGERTTKVDGWGVITTPYGESIPCIRVKSSITSRDSIVATGTPGFAITSNEVEYKWLVKGEKIPLLEIRGNLIGGVFIPTQIRYRDNYRNTNPIAVDFEANKQLAHNTDTVTFIIINGQNLNNVTWQFTPSNGINFVNGTSANSPNPSVIFTLPGNYSVNLSGTNLFGNQNVNKNDYIQVNNLQVSRLQTLSTPMFFPNPTQENITVQHLPEKGIIRLYNMQGKMVLAQDADTNDTIIRTSELKAGVYSLVFITNKSVVTLPQKLIKQN